MHWDVRRSSDAWEALEKSENRKIQTDFEFKLRCSLSFAIVALLIKAAWNFWVWTAQSIVSKYLEANYDCVSLNWGPQFEATVFKALLEPVNGSWEFAIFRYLISFIIGSRLMMPAIWLPSITGFSNARQAIHHRASRQFRWTVSPEVAIEDLDSELQWPIKPFKYRTESNVFKTNSSCHWSIRGSLPEHL